MRPSFWDRVPRFDLVLANRRIGSWVVMSRVGAVAGAACFSVASLGLISATTIAAIVTANLGTFLILQAFARRWRGGRYVLLEHVAAAASGTVAVGWLSHVDVVDVMAVWIPAICVTLACGRVGCLMSGCCHGQVASWGVRYPWQLPWIAGGSWEQLRVLPVQAFESLTLLCLAAAGFVMRGAPDVVAVIPTLYAVVRFELEFLRGDTRRQVGPLSHNQCWCMLILGIVIAATHSLIAIIASGILVLTVIALRGRLAPALPLSSLPSFRQLQQALIRLQTEPSVSLDRTILVLRDREIEVDAARTSLLRSGARALEQTINAPHAIVEEMARPRAFSSDAVKRA